MYDELLRAGALHTAELTLNGILGRSLLASLIPQIDGLALKFHDLRVARRPPSGVPCLVVTGGKHQLHLRDRGDVESAIND